MQFTIVDNISGCNVIFHETIIMNRYLKNYTDHTKFIRQIRRPTMFCSLFKKVYKTEFSIDEVYRILIRHQRSNKQVKNHITMGWKVGNDDI